MQQFAGTVQLLIRAITSCLSFHKVQHLSGCGHVRSSDVRVLSRLPGHVFHLMSIGSRVPYTKHCVKIILLIVIAVNES